MARRDRVGSALVAMRRGGADGRHVRTTKEPIQPIPTFAELVELLLEVSGGVDARVGAESQPENRHVSLNVRFVAGHEEIES